MKGSPDLGQADIHITYTSHVLSHRGYEYIKTSVALALASALK